MDEVEYLAYSAYAGLTLDMVVRCYGFNVATNAAVGDCPVRTVSPALRWTHNVEAT